MEYTEFLTSPEKFYYALQNSRTKDDAFEQWTDYRRDVTDLLISSCDKGKTLAIFGAGRCDDIDLKRLSRHFSQITLIDINDKAMQSAVWKYSLSRNVNIKMIVKDFVGIRDEDYIRYVYAMLKEFKEYALYDDASDAAIAHARTARQLESMYQQARSHHLDFGSKAYDYSIALNVHSQLNDTADWIRTQLSSILGDQLDPNNHLAARIIGETASIVKKFNDAMLKATKELAFIGYETGVEGHVSSGVQGAIQTFVDLRNREQRNELRTIKQTHLIWPYNREDNMVFKIQMETLMLSKAAKGVH